MSFRLSITWLHTWTGLLGCWLLYFMFITGSTGYFDDEISRWMQPEIPVQMSSFDAATLLPKAEEYLRDVAPDAAHYYIDFPVGRSPFYTLWWQTQSDPQTGRKGIWYNKKLDPNTGAIVTPRDTHGGELLYRMHYVLHYMPTSLAHWITSTAAMLMLVGLISGVVIHRRIFKDFFSFRRRKPDRSWLDLHNLAGVLPLPFHLMITYSGLILLMFTTMLAVPVANYGAGKEIRMAYDRFFSEHEVREASGNKAPLVELSTLYQDAAQRSNGHPISFISVDNPGDSNGIVSVGWHVTTGLTPFQPLHYDAVNGARFEEQEHSVSGAKTFYDTMEHLHEGQFAGPLLRWLYFFSGIAGAVMVASGGVLWAIRRQQHQKAKGLSVRGLGLVQSLNVGTFVGLPIAIACYFIANRLLPLELAGRGDWEVHCLFIAWLIMLMHAFVRSRRVDHITVWQEQLLLASVIFAAIPVINAITSSVHLGETLFYGDWVLASFDLFMLALALVFGVARYKLRAKTARQSEPCDAELGEARL